jgi:pSer/pThr/pTyr-binding forkhead associated (FHA) protein
MPIQGPVVPPIVCPPEKPVVLGRSSQADVQLSDQVVSRQHCKIENRGETWLITDLAIMAAILSSYGQKSLPKYSLFLGEVGLTGDIRPVWGLEQRLKESIKLGRRSLILAVGKGDYQQGLSKEAIDQCEWVGLKSIFDLKTFFTNIFNPTPNK